MSDLTKQRKRAPSNHKFFHSYKISMIHITIFTGDDLNSRALVKVLSERRLPFTEISLTAYPSKSSDLKALTGTVAVPRVFFGTRHVGGFEKTIRELKRMDSDPEFRNRVTAVCSLSHNNPKLIAHQCLSIAKTRKMEICATLVNLQEQL